MIYYLYETLRSLSSLHFYQLSFTHCLANQPRQLLIPFRRYHGHFKIVISLYKLHSTFVTG